MSEWGMGRAPLLESVTNESVENVVVIGDLHVPHHDTEVVASAIRLIKKVKPHTVVLNGDVADFFQLSRFNTGAERLESLQDEIDEANVIRHAIRKAAPNARFLETEGNHDQRIKSYVAANARALKSLRSLTPEVLFDYKALGIEWYSGAGFRIRPNFLIRHGTIVRGEVGATAKAELASAGLSGLSGHTHRLGTYRRVGYDVKSWTEGGCMCRLDPDYVKGGVPNWSQGAVIAQFSTVSDAFLVEEIQVLNGKLVWGGKSY